MSQDSLAWRPAQLTTRQEMQMQVIDALGADFAVIDDDSESIIQLHVGCNLWRAMVDYFFT